jgi:hypothetical protein
MPSVLPVICSAALSLIGVAFPFVGGVPGRLSFAVVQ